MIQKILKLIKKVILWAVLASVLGLILTFFNDWPIFKGHYISFIIIGVIFLAYSALQFIGTPSDRFKFFSAGRYELSSKDDNKSYQDDGGFFGILKPHFDLDDDNKILGDKGWVPAIIGVLLIAYGFLIEAIFHI
ncbi:MAG: hypothetical protein ACQEQE_03115 [Bacillota bacterium]